MQQSRERPGSAITLTSSRPPLSRRLWRLAQRQPVMVVSSVVIFVASMASIFAPALGVPDPTENNMSEIRQSPSSSHLLGTDHLGRDQLSRVLHGGRISLTVGVFGVLLGVCIGAVWGIASGYAVGRFDAISQRLVEIVLAIPALLMAFVLAAALGQGLMTVIVAIAVINVGQTTRVLRAVTLAAKEADYVTAARAIGATPFRVAAVHVAPNSIPAFLVIFSAQLGVGILTEATLGFLGIGVKPPAPSWGSLVAEPLTISRAPEWWLIIVPGLVIAFVVLAFNLLGDTLRDELDPRLRGSR